MLKKAVPARSRQRQSDVIADIRHMIEETRSRIATAMNARMTFLYWRIGKRIHEEILGGARAEYGKEIVVVLALQLTSEYGNGFSEKNLRRMVQFAQVFPEEEIVATLSRQLCWSHFTTLIPLKDQLQREFYTQMCRVENWSVRTLRKQIDSMLYERTVISREPDEVVYHALDELKTDNRMVPDLVFRDPYVLDFLGLADHYRERDLEDAILREMESFLLELGVGFTFVERQKRIRIDDDDFYIDLLFFNRKWNRLVVVELKMEKFKPEHKGQMELYLRWLDRYEREEGEGSPFGIILCAGKKQEQIELLALDKSSIHVAEYLTQLPPPEVLQERFQTAIRNAQARWDRFGS